MKRTIIILHNGVEVLRLTKTNPIIMAGLWEGFKTETFAVNTGVEVMLLNEKHQIIDRFKYEPTKILA